jgi:hypothetical protein
MTAKKAKIQKKAKKKPAVPNSKAATAKKAKNPMLHLSKIQSRASKKVPRPPKRLHVSKRPRTRCSIFQRFNLVQRNSLW